MHQNGIGLEKDNPLAKRYYDHAIEVSTESYLPCSLALFSLATEDYQKYLTKLVTGVTLDKINTQLSDLVQLYVGPSGTFSLPFSCFSSSPLSSCSGGSETSSS